MNIFGLEIQNYHRCVFFQFVGRCHFDVPSLFRLTLLQSLYVEINVKLLKYKKSKVIL